MIIAAYIGVILGAAVLFAAIGEFADFIIPVTATLLWGAYLVWSFHTVFA